MQYFDINIAAGITRQIDADGDYFYYYAGSAGGADSSVELKGRSSGLSVILQPGQAYRLQPGKRESTWTVRNRGSGAIVGTVVIGSGEITDNRVTGTVDVIDGGKARTIAGDVFGWRLFYAALAGNLNYGMIWNGAASSMRLVIKSYMANVPASAGISNAVGGWALAGTISSKLSGGAAPAAWAAYGQQAAATPAGVTLFTTAPANVPVVEPEPIVILPGFGFVMATDSMAVSSIFTAHVVEEPL